MTPAIDRVALHLPGLYGGGAEKAALKLAAEFRRRGLGVDFLLGHHTGELCAEVPAGARVIELGATALRRKFRGMVGYLREARPPALLTFLDISNVAGLARVAARVPTRVVAILQNCLSEELRLAYASRRRVFRAAKHLYRLADEIVGVSEGVAADAAALMPFVRDRISVIPNPVVSPELLAAAQEPVGHPWLAGSGPPVVIAVGRLHPQKDYPTLLRAFRQVRDRREARLVILGVGPLRGELEDEAARLGLGSSVAWPGFVNNPYAWVAKADLFVLSSVWEGLPTVVIEAMAVGTPVVATDCPHGPREILDGGRLGPLVPVGDDRALADAICVRLDAPRDAERLATRGAEFGVARSADNYLQLIANNLSGLPRRDNPFLAQVSGSGR